MRSMRAKPPQVRPDGLLVEQVGDEVVVYDTDSKEAHCLSPLAAAVFNHCDGQTRVDHLPAAVSASLGETVDAERVGDALVQLEERKLLAAPVATRAGVSRRDLLRRTAAVGAAAAAVPLIVSIVAPTPAAAQTRTCGQITCCPCGTGATGQPCCEHATAFQCNCTAKEAGASCKQCKIPQGSAGTDVVCLGLFPPTGIPAGAPCPCTTAVC